MLKVGGEALSTRITYSINREPMEMYCILINNSATGNASNGITMEM